MVALAVADLSGVPLSGAVKSLAAFTGFKNRQQIAEKNGVTIIDDTYNASPVSMKLVWRSWRRKQRDAVLRCLLI